MGRREEAEVRGRRAEALAPWWLRASGYRVLARRVKLHAGEIDLAARKCDAICFIEVRARATRRSAP